MSRTLDDLDIREEWFMAQRILYYSQLDMNNLIDERVIQLEKNKYNRFTRHNDDADTEKEIIKMIRDIVNCRDEEEAKEIMPELIEFGRKEELRRLKGDGK